MLETQQHISGLVNEVTIDFYDFPTLFALAKSLALFNFQFLSVCFVLVVISAVQCQQPNFLHVLANWANNSSK